MRLGRIFTSLFAAVVVTTVITALAANLGVNTHSLGAGGASVARCDADGFGVAYNLGDENAVVSVTISDIHADCDLGTLRVTLTNASDVAQGSGSVTAAAGSVVVPVSPTPGADDVDKVYIVIEGGQQ